MIGKVNNSAITQAFLKAKENKVKENNEQANKLNALNAAKNKRASELSSAQSKKLDAAKQREAFLAGIKADIESGSYKPDTRKIAEAMAQNLLNL